MSRPDRVVVDTNVLVSGLYRLDSPPGRVLMLGAEDRLELLAPEAVRHELRRILQDKLDYADDEVEETLTALPVEWVDPAVFDDHLPPAEDAISDPDDVPVVALALALDAPAVSGDADFHPLDEPIVETEDPAGLVAAVDDPGDE